MIPRTVLTVWRTNQAPWPGDDQIEQDLIISRALYQRKKFLPTNGGRALANRTDPAV